MPISNPFHRLGLLMAATMIALDQLSKHYLLGIFRLPERGQVEVLPFFNLVSVWNHGVSFGMFSNPEGAGRFILIAIAAVIALVLYGWLRKAEGRLASLAIGLVIGGALGNIIDRLVLGAVFDFLDVHAYGYHWPAFNVADSAICIGVFILCIESFLPSRIKEPA